MYVCSIQVNTDQITPPSKRNEAQVAPVIYFAASPRAPGIVYTGHRRATRYYLGYLSCYFNGYLYWYVCKQGYIRSILFVFSSVCFVNVVSLEVCLVSPIPPTRPDPMKHLYEKFSVVVFNFFFPPANTNREYVLLVHAYLGTYAIRLCKQIIKIFRRPLSFIVCCLLVGLSTYPINKLTNT